MLEAERYRTMVSASDLDIGKENVEGLTVCRCGRDGAAEAIVQINDTLAFGLHLLESFFVSYTTDGA